MTRDAVKGFDHPKLEALVETLFLAAYADDEFSAEERQHFTRTVQTLTDGRVDEDTLGQWIARFEAALAASDRGARLAAVKQRLASAAERKVALTLAVEMAAADGIIRTSERELILDVAEGLDIDRGEAADIVKQHEPR